MISYIRYTHVVKVEYREGRRLDTIKKINDFILNQANGPSAKHPLYDKKGAATQATGMEVSFRDAGDAVMFKLCWVEDENE